MVAELVDNKTKMKALRICQQYMGGSWMDIDENQFCIEHISGGLSNLLYACSIDSEKTLENGEERKVYTIPAYNIKVLIRFIAAKVLLRLYGKIIREHPEAVVSDSVIFGLLAEKRLGPRLYGVFSEGRVEEYINSRHLYTYELHKPDVSAYCARMMSQFHQLKMPLCKQPSWLYSTMLRYIEDIKINPKFGSTFMGMNLSDEVDNLRRLLSKLNSPVVFCHNDLQEGNILLSTELPDKWTLLPIDFEYASYNYRGFDIGNHFCEWCYDYSVEEAPYYSAKLENYPTRDEQLIFIRAYLSTDYHEDCNDLELLHRDAGDDNVSNRESHILREIEGFSLASHFLWCLWAVVQSYISEIKFGYLEYGKDRMKAYLLKKTEFIAHYNLQ